MFRHFFDVEGHGHARFFEKGDLKYVILDLLKEKPRHGYEIIRAMEEHFHGFYSPSAGSIYPTLQLLEDMGYIKASEQDGKKVYTITEDGKRFLTEREEIFSKIRGRMQDWWQLGNREEFFDILHEIRGLMQAVGRKFPRLDHEKVARIKEVVHKACQDIQAIIEE
ncbi:MAG: PadR family transcriptional regulator [Dehalococcoidales bacterium]|nr:PadR family transcriptional regulator [Dehalococcoidales bacterium]